MLCTFVQTFRGAVAVNAKAEKNPHNLIRVIPAKGKSVESL
jgi:hypothetical protein